MNYKIRLKFFSVRESLLFQSLAYGLNNSFVSYGGLFSRECIAINAVLNYYTNSDLVLTPSSIIEYSYELDWMIDNVFPVHVNRKKIIEQLSPVIELDIISYDILYDYFIDLSLKKEKKNEFSRKNKTI